MARKKASERNVVVGDIHEVSGEVTIAGRDIYKGYTTEQVSVLLTQITSTFQPKPFDGRCPYKGLDVFEEEDADLFFGRERLVDDLVARVKESRAVFITGPSGSGKSSLLRAGLIPALKQGAIKNSERWLYETMKPGREPLKDLALAFSRLKSPELANYFREHANEINVLNECAESLLSGRKDQRLVLFIDQFEETFTQINLEQERLAFLKMLAHAGIVENGRVIVLFAMRSDFVSNCATYPMINELISQQFRQIGAMQPEELVSAIALPARHVGLPIEDELIARIINDMKGEPGALPLMQFALKDLFDSQQEKGGVIALTLKDYLQHGGIHKSLERHADTSLAKLNENEQELARSIFSGLIEIGRGTQDTKRTALFDELIPANTKPEEVKVIVGKLADARLITTDEQAGKDTVMISHEKLIDAWPWLKTLVDENRDVIALQNEITNDAKEWEDHQRDASYLYTGARLATAREKLNARRLVLSGLAQEFVLAGLARQRRGQLFLISGIFVGVITLAALAIFGFVQAGAAEERAEISRARELAAESVALRDRNFLSGLLLGVEAYHIGDLVQTRGALLNNRYAHPRLQSFLSLHYDDVTSLAFSPDGKTLASASWDGSIILWDVAIGKPLGQPIIGHAGSVNSVAFSPDGKILASGGADQTIILWDVVTRQPIGQPLWKHSNIILDLVFSPDGEILASSSRDQTIILWDVASGQSIAEPLSGHKDWVNDLAFSPDGRMLASGSQDKTIILWDVANGQRIAEPLVDHQHWVTSLAFSPDGKMLASGSQDDTIILWDVTTKRAIGEPLRAHSGSVESLAFSPDGRTLASGSGDNSIILWNTDTRQPIGQPLSGHANTVLCVLFSPDGKMLASSGGDNSIILWSMDTGLVNNQPRLLHRSGVFSVAFSPAGKTLALGTADGYIYLWDTEQWYTEQSVSPALSGHTASVESVAFSPDGKMLASGSRDQSIILWDVATGQRIGQPLNGHSNWVRSVAFSPDGKILASGGGDQTIILWDVITGQPIGQPLKGHTEAIQSLAFSPDGRMIASGSQDQTIILWNVASGQAIGQPLIGPRSWVFSVAFSPDGRILASSNGDHTIILWDIAERKPIGQPLLGHANDVRSVAFSPDGNLLASGDTNNSIILWDVATGQAIGQPLHGHTDGVFSVALSRDGKYLASASTDKFVVLWDLDPLAWIQIACQRVHRNFTLEEWQRYFPKEEYRKTCEQWPKDSSYYRAMIQEIFLDSNESQKIQRALNKIKTEMKMDSSIEDATLQASELVGEYVSNEIQNKINTDIENPSRWQEVLSLIKQAKQNNLFPRSMRLLDNICWSGSLNGYAEQVLEYCEEAVTLFPDNPIIRESRGLARALTGDFAGAINDFQFYVDYADREPSKIEQREHWIADLKAEINPFTDDVLKELKSAGDVD